VFIDERHHEGDGRRTHRQWHEHEDDRAVGSIRELLSQNRY
jgi:hypothetical protein